MDTSNNLKVMNPRFSSARRGIQEGVHGKKVIPKLNLYLLSTINVVLVGETGVGKSSVINLIAQDDVAEVSSSIEGHTMQSTQYIVPFDGLNFSIFETVGLDQPQYGEDEYLDAIEKAHELVERLRAVGGIHLLLFCMRGGRITTTTQSNYRLFCEGLCNKKVPIALVFTGLEKENKLEDWWTRNKQHVEHFGIKSDGHACITGVRTPGEDHKFMESQKKIRELLKNCALKNNAFMLETDFWFIKLGRGMRSFIAKHRNPRKRDVVNMLTQRRKLAPDAANMIAKMMEKGNLETKPDDPPGGIAANPLTDRRGGENDVVEEESVCLPHNSGDTPNESEDANKSATEYPPYPKWHSGAEAEPLEAKKDNEIDSGRVGNAEPGVVVIQQNHWPSDQAREGNNVPLNSGLGGNEQKKTAPPNFTHSISTTTHDKNKKPGMNSSDDSAITRTLSKTQPTIFNVDLSDYYVHGPEASAKNISLSLKMSKAYNILIFGDSGVGKSSLINMLAGQKTAVTSDGVLACTFRSHQYQFTVGGERINVWDTAGFDEGTRGRVSPEVAERNLVKLLQDLRKANGVHLLVYCIRGPSVRKSLARNYAVFYSAICRKKVPIVTVVTGLENEPDSMDNWWIRGEKELAKYKMRFDAHACVTTIDMNKLVGSVFEERSRSSQEAVRRLIIDQCHRPAVRPPTDSNIFIKAALHDFRSMVRSSWDDIGPSGPSASVVFSQIDVQLIHTGIFGDPRQIRSQIKGRWFVFHHVSDSSGRYINPKLPKSGADLLIFAAQKAESPNLEKFANFYESYGGEVCPLLIVTDDHDCVRSWTGYLNERGISGRVESFSKDGRCQADLLDLIDELCLVRGATTKSGKEKILRYLRRGSKENSIDT